MLPALPSSSHTTDQHSVWRYSIALAAVAVALLLSELLRPIVVLNPFLFAFGAIAVSAGYGGLGPSLLAIVLSMLGTNYLFIPPFYRFSVAPLDIVQVGGFAFVAILISSISDARRRAEQAAQAQREQLQVTLRSIGDAVIATDSVGRVTFLNQVAATLTGWAIPEAKGQPIDAVFSIVNADTRQRVESPVTRVLREGVVVGLANHTILIDRAGAEHPIDDSGAPIRNAEGQIIGVVLVFRDVTERKRVEAERARLLASEQAARAKAERASERLAFLAEASDQLVASLDYGATLQRVARLCVPGLADWCVIDIPAPDGTLVMQVVAHADPAKEQWARTLRERYPVSMDMPAGAPLVIRTGEPLLYAEVPDTLLVQVARDDEELRLLRLVGYQSALIVPLRTHDRIIGSLGLVTADSGRRYTSDDLALAEELAHRAGVALDNARLYQAAAAARTAAEEAVTLRDRFLSVASHELKTPLTSLLLQTQFLQRRLDRAALLPEREQRALQVVSEQAQRLNRMIDALLDISRLESGQLSLSRTLIDVGALVRRVVAEVQPTTDAHPITSIGPERALLVNGDELRLEQVLQNVLQNAIKYSPHGGPVEITVVAEMGEVAITVSDRGIGFPDEALPRLFDRFYRASNADPRHISGLGIGLYIVQEIVRLHGGSVRAARQEGGGSRFTICLSQAIDDVGE